MTAMDTHVVLVGVAALVSGSLVWLTARAVTGSAARRGILLLAVVQVAVFYVATADLLGRPKPATVELFGGRLTEAQALAYDLRQDEAIFVWARPAGATDPIAYRLPWNEQTARALYAAQQKAETEGGSVQLTMIDDGTEGGEPAVGWVPPAAPPPKARP